MMALERVQNAVKVKGGTQLGPTEPALKSPNSKPGCIKALGGLKLL